MVPFPDVPTPDPHSDGPEGPTQADLVVKFLSHGGRSASVSKRTVLDTTGAKKEFIHRKK